MEALWKLELSISVHKPLRVCACVCVFWGHCGYKERGDLRLQALNKHFLFNTYECLTVWLQRKLYACDLVLCCIDKKTRGSLQLPSSASQR